MELHEQILTEVKKAVFGKDELLEKILIAILARGHILLEDVPGVGKTTIAKAFAKTLGLKSKRMQFTVDVLPSDVVGFSVIDPDTREVHLHPGAVFCNIFLADEINRTSSRTQAALLEVMEENSITVDGTTYPAYEPFIVIATQNPFGSAGTQTSVYKGYKRDKIEMRRDRAEMSDFPLYLNTVAGGLDRRDQTIGGFSFVVKIYAVPVVEIIG